ncbi:hypothetical protein ACXXDK_13720 [Deinococcus sp. PESE-38]
MTLTDQLEDRLSNHDTVETLAEELQPVLRAALDYLPEGVVSALHGDPQGHPLHPALVHLPLGAGWWRPCWISCPEGTNKPSAPPTSRCCSPPSARCRPSRRAGPTGATPGGRPAALA